MCRMLPFYLPHLCIPATHTHLLEMEALVLQSGRSNYSSASTRGESLRTALTQRNQLTVAATLSFSFAPAGSSAVSHHPVQSSP